MEQPILYRGVWPQNVSKLAKYAVKFIDGAWRVSVIYEAGEGLRYLAVEGGGAELAERVNNVKTAYQNQPGGAFYVNEYLHVIVPAKSQTPAVRGSLYYFAGRLETDLSFQFEGQALSTKPVRPDGTPLVAGERWEGPRPGIPYVLAAGGGDIYFESPALTDDDPPAVRPSMARRVQLSNSISSRVRVAEVIKPILSIRGHQGGRFYVNEHGAMFTPVGAGDGNGLDYIYCGQVDRSAWFPEPKVD